MKRVLLGISAVCLCAGSGVTVVHAAGAAAQAQTEKSSIEFIVRATPTGGVEEPVRGFPVFLLNKSFEEIQQEADAAFPKQKLDDFIDGLDVSKDLKDWMKRTQWISFSGHDFIKKLKADDILGVPEFLKAYLARNAGDQSTGLPQPKFKESEKTKDPAKYDKDLARYHDALRHYIEMVPESINGIDLELVDIDPNRKWREVEAKRSPQVHRRITDLAQGKYLVARTETNLQGQGFFPAVPPGNYWLSTLDVTANVGDARPRWDVPVTIRPGQVSYAVLSNVNAVQEAAHASP